MSQAWISSLVGLRPMLYDGACAHAAVEAASAIMGTNELDRHIANAPVAVHFPGVNSVEITHVHGALQLKVVHVDAPDFRELGKGGLHLAFVVRAAGLKHRF